MSVDDWQLYQQLYAELLFAPAARPPRLMLYLHGPLDVILSRIATRGRPLRARRRIPNISPACTRGTSAGSRDSRVPSYTGSTCGSTTLFGCRGRRRGDRGPGARELGARSRRRNSGRGSRGRLRISSRLGRRAAGTLPCRRYQGATCAQARSRSPGFATSRSRSSLVNVSSGRGASICSPRISEMTVMPSASNGGPVSATLRPTKGLRPGARRPRARSPGSPRLLRTEAERPARPSGRGALARHPLVAEDPQRDLEVLLVVRRRVAAARDLRFVTLR